jgi:hypothetical protein
MRYWGLCHNWNSFVFDGRQAVKASIQEAERHIDVAV